MNQRLAAFFGALALAAGVAAAPAVAQPAAASSAPAARPAAIDPAVDKAVRELLDHLQYREQMKAHFEMGAAQLPQIMLRAHAQRINANTKLTTDQKKAELAIVANGIPKQAEAAQRALADPKLIDDAFNAIVAVYAGKFTLAELNELNAIQRRPVSLKMRSVMPEVSQETRTIVQRLMGERVGKLLQQKPAAAAK
jgi:hypothetical protein